MSIKGRLVKLINFGLKPLRAKLAKSKENNSFIEPFVDPRLAAKVYPYLWQQNSYVLAPPSEEQTKVEGDSLPIPREEMWLGYGRTPEEYLASGKRHIDAMKSIIADSGWSLDSATRILEFGCASGRMLRWLHDVSASRELWGVDLYEPTIIWCQRHMSPPMNFLLTTSFPHLPFEDRYFDFIFAGSVFTHIPDLDDAWLLELKRILRPGGRMYLTIHDEHNLDLIYTPERPPLREETRKFFLELLAPLNQEVALRAGEFEKIVVCRIPGQACRHGIAQVFYHTDFIRRQWGKFLKVVSTTQEAYGYQTAVLLERTS
jgi:SAM-dependent methyltransferase